MNYDIAGLQIVCAELIGSGFACIVVGKCPNTAEIAVDHHIAVNLVIRICGSLIQRIHITCYTGAVRAGAVSQIQTLFDIDLLIIEEDVHQLLDFRKLQVQTGRLIIDPLGKDRTGRHCGSDLVAVIAVPF